LKDSAGSAEDSRVNAEVLPGAVRVHVGKILASKEFIHSDSLRRFLSYTVEKAIEGEPGCLKESVLGTTLFGRGDAFDPRLDPIVRVQAGKLRTRLQQYYEGEGRAPMPWSSNSLREAMSQFSMPVRMGQPHPLSTQVHPGRANSGGWPPG